MSFACFLCTPRNFRSRKRPCCPDLDHFLLVLIATLSVHSILRIYVTGVTAIHPIYIQAVSSQTLTATCLEGPDWNCDRNSEDDDWKENMREVTSKNWKNWKVKVLHLLMWKLLWNIVMNRVHGRLQHWYRDIIGWDLWCCIGVCYVVGKQPGRGGQPVMFGSSDKKSLIWCELLMWRSLLMRLDWCLAPTTGTNFTNFLNFLNFTDNHCMNIMNQVWLRKCHFFHARLCTSLDGGNLTGDTGLYIYAPWPRWEAIAKLI